MTIRTKDLRKLDNCYGQNLVFIEFLGRKVYTEKFKIVTKNGPSYELFYIYQPYQTAKDRLLSTRDVPNERLINIYNRIAKGME
jgi:hypothetical protein